MRFVNNVKTTILLAALISLCMLLGYGFFGGPMGMTIGLFIGLFMNLGVFFYSDRIAIASMRGQQISRQDLPWLHDMIADLAERAGLPMPRVYVCPQQAPNAFATGRSPKHAAVAVTEGMLRAFSRDEIEGVMAHELAHVRHRDTLISTLAATMAGVISHVAYMAMWFGGGSDRRDNPLGAIGMIAMIVLAPLAAALIQMAISRQREYAADNFGGELCGNPLKLARALERLGALNERIPTDTNPAFHSMYIVEPLHGGVASLFSTHPPLEKRITALRRQAAEMGL